MGVEIFTNFTRIQSKKVVALKAKVRWITRRNTGNNVAEVIRELNPVLRGFVNYFRVANCVRELRALMGWIRRRLRCVQLKQWKTNGKLQRRLRQLGYKPPFKAIKMKSWRNSASPLSSYSMPNTWLHKKMELVDMTSTQVGISVSWL